MPELPEVETIRSQLSAILPFEVKSTAQTKELKQNVLHTKLSLNGLTFTQASRKGKLLDFILSDGSHLLSHLGMTGTWLITTTRPTNKHAHLILEGITPHGPKFLVYDDPRRFGHMYHLTNDEAHVKLAELGPDLASPEFTLEFMIAAFKRMPGRAIKVALLDQKYFAGSGNYIANEICAHAGIRPTRLCSKIKAAEFPKIFAAIHLVISGAIDSGGTTFQGGYRDTSGEKGLGVNNLVVFWQKTCQLCKTSAVKKIVLAQRGTYYCPKCQS
jgi:formamidopyrimidine-DNA glycosylase